MLYLTVLCMLVSAFSLSPALIFAVQGTRSLRLHHLELPVEEMFQGI